MAYSPPRRFTPWLVRLRRWYHCDTTTETLCLQPSFHSFPRFSISITFFLSASVQGLMCDNQLKARRRCVNGWHRIAINPGANRPRCVGESARGGNKPKNVIEIENLGKEWKEVCRHWVSVIVSQWYHVRGRTSQGAKEPGGETAKGRKSQIPLDAYTQIHERQRLKHNRAAMLLMTF